MFFVLYILSVVFSKVIFVSEIVGHVNDDINFVFVCLAVKVVPIAYVLFLLVFIITSSTGNRRLSISNLL